MAAKLFDGQMHSRTFELNFTTKGFGIGLASVQAIVGINCGEIDVSSEVRIGMTLKMRFPAITTQTDAAVSPYLL